MRETRERRRRERKPIAFTDYTLLFSVFFLLVFGLVMIYSASYYEANETFGKPTYYFNKQLIATVVGLVAMLFTVAVPYRNFYHFQIIPVVVATVLMLLLKVPLFAYSANGATRWLRLGPFTLQPAEVVKLMLIIYMAGFLTKRKDQLATFKDAVIAIIIPVYLAALVLVLSNNFSSAIIVGGIGVIMLFVAAPDYKKYFITLLAVIAIVVIAVIIILKTGENVENTEDMNFRFERVLAWNDPEKFADGKGYQTLQSLYAIGSGGLWGKGLGESIQKLGFIPEAQNDMIFSIICEELGLFGAAVVLLLFFALIYRCYMIATHVPDMYGCLLVTGVMAHISLQVVLNVAVVTNLIPNTGISLPFISYGGSSVILLMAEIGIVINVSRTMPAE